MDTTTSTQKIGNPILHNKSDIPDIKPVGEMDSSPTTIRQLADINDISNQMKELNRTATDLEHRFAETIQQSEKNLMQLRINDQLLKKNDEALERCSTYVTKFQDTIRKTNKTIHINKTKQNIVNGVSFVALGIFIGVISLLKKDTLNPKANFSAGCVATIMCIFGLKETWQNWKLYNQEKNS